MTRKLIAFVASIALATPVLGAQQSKAPANKPAAQTTAKPAATSKNDSAKADSSKGAKKGTNHKASTKGGAKNMSNDSAKGGNKKP